jgi:DNA excision repair protein ERCC-2
MELREDQREIAKRLVKVLKSSQWVALQAPTGWGKTPTVLTAIKELGEYPALWLVPRLSIGVHVYRHAIDVGLRALLTAGKEKLCPFGFSLIDFARGVCHRCSLNRPISLGELDSLDASMDFGEIKVLGESRQICPYKVQDFLEKRGRYITPPFF